MKRERTYKDHLGTGTKPYGHKREVAVELRRFLYPTYDSEGNVSRKIMDLEPGDCQRILNDFAVFLGMEEGS